MGLETLQVRGRDLQEDMIEPQKQPVQEQVCTVQKSVEIQHIRVIIGTE